LECTTSNSSDSRLSQAVDQATGGKGNKYVTTEMSSVEVSNVLVTQFPDLNDFISFIDTQRIDGIAFQSLNHTILEAFGVASYGLRDRILRCQIINKSEFTKLNSGEVRSVLKNLYGSGANPVQPRYKVRNGEPVCKEELYERMKKEQQKKSEQKELKEKKSSTIKIIDKESQ